MRQTQCTEHICNFVNFLEAGPAIDQSVLAFLEGAVEAGSLCEALGIDDPEIQQYVINYSVLIHRCSFQHSLF